MQKKTRTDADKDRATRLRQAFRRNKAVVGTMGAQKTRPGGAGSSFHSIQAANMRSMRSRSVLQDKV